MKKEFFSKIFLDARKNLFAYRRFLRGSAFEYVVVTLLFSLASIVYTNWVAFDISDRIFVGAGGGDATAGFLWLNTVSPGVSPFLGHTDMINFPLGEELSSPTHITYLLLLLPMRVLAFLFNPVAALNIMTMFAFVMAGVTAYFLLKRLTNSVPASFFAGFATAFVPYSLMKGSAHLSYIYSGVFVLILAAFIGFWLKPNWKRAVLLGVVTAGSFYTDGYFILLASVMVLALCLGGSAFTVLVDGWRSLIPRLKGLLVSFMALIITLTPLAYVQLSQGGQVKQGLAESRSDIRKEFELYRTDMLDFIVPVEHPLLNGWTKYQKLEGTKNLRSNPSESANYLGVVVVLAAGVGLAFMFAFIFHRNKGTLHSLGARDRRKFILLGSVTISTTLVFLSFMFSPNFEVLGVTIPLPGQLLLDYNVSLWRVMSRFFIPLHVVLVAFAAYSLWVLLKTAKFGGNTERKKVMIWTVFIVLIVCTAIEYLTLANRPSFELSRVPKTYSWIRDRSDIRVVAEFPVVNQLNLLTGDYLTHQLIHDKKLVNARTGVAGGPLGYYGSLDNPESIDFARLRGADAIVVSARECTNGYKWGELVYSENVINPKNPKLCTYKLRNIQYEQTDAYYARFDKGVLVTPLFSDTYEMTSVLELDKVGLEIANFKKPDTSKTKLHLTMKFVPVLDPAFSGEWQLQQKGSVIAQGDITASKGMVDAYVSSEAPITLSVKSRTAHGLTKHGIGIQDVVVDSVE